MRASVAGIIFANSHDERLGRLTTIRSMASVPFGGRYRMIDFCLSNLVNAGITSVGIIPKENYRSLMDHIGSGIYWDLDRKSGGVHILPPFNQRGNRRYHGYIEALYGSIDFMKRSKADYIVLCDSSVVANIDINAVVDAHIKKGADVTVVYDKTATVDKRVDTIVLDVDSDDKITAINFQTDKDVSNRGLGVTVFNRDFLINSVEESYIQGGGKIERDILIEYFDEIKIYGYCHNGFVAVMDSTDSYIDANMKLLESDVRKDLFNKERPIYTKTRDDMPTRYGTQSDVKNSFIAEGCVIEGTVKNSVLFRGVTVGKGAVVEDSILMQSVQVKDNAVLKNVVCDKNAVVNSGMTALGTEDRVFFVEKNKQV